jgi:hypothetical protein
MEYRCLLWFYLYCDIFLEFNLVPFVSNYNGVGSLACVRSGQEFLVALISTIVSKWVDVMNDFIVL